MTNDLFEGPASGFGKGKVNILQARTRFRAVIDGSHSASLATVVRRQMS
jgi:hypothetical protein